MKRKIWVNRKQQAARWAILLFVLLVVVVGLLSCGGTQDPQPPPPPPPTTTTIPELPPPPPKVEPNDYITLTRAGGLGERCVTSTGLLRELCFDEQALIWDGVRNPTYALDHCCSELPGPWPFTVMVRDGECISPEVELNEAVHEDLLFYMRQLQRVNKRCAVSHPEHAPEFCGRTDVRRKFFKEWREDYLEPAMVVAEGLNNIKGWCQDQ